MSIPEFQHLRLSMLADVVLVETLSRDVQGPDRAQVFVNELVAVADQEGDGPILVDLRRTIYLSSMGFAALFKMVKQAKARQRMVRFCNMHPDVRVGAEVVGLPHVVEIHDCQESALKAFAADQASQPGV